MDLKIVMAAWDVPWFLSDIKVQALSLLWSLPHKKFSVPLHIHLHLAYFHMEIPFHYNRESIHNQIQDPLKHVLSSDEVYVNSYPLPS